MELFLYFYNFTMNFTKMVGEKYTDFDALVVNCKGYVQTNSKTNIK